MVFIMKATLLITVQNNQASFKYSDVEMKIKVADCPDDGLYVMSGRLGQGKNENGRFKSLWLKPTNILSITQTPLTATKSEETLAKKKSTKKSTKATPELAAANPFA
jgi:hypothetical protein